MKPVPEAEEVMAPLQQRALGPTTFNPIYEAVVALLRNDGRRAAERLVSAVEEVVASRERPDAATRLTSRAWEILESLRREGWVVACHNDYRQGCRAFTFWLFTRGGSCFSGEGMTDREALEAVRKQVDEATPPGERGPS